MNVQQEINALSKQIERDVISNRNFKNFDSSLSFDEGESALNYSAENSILDFDNKSEKVIGLSTYNVKCVYVAGAGGLPVEVQLFGTNFNTGVVVGNTLVFTNATGDTVTVTGITSPITAFQDRLRSAAFKVAYVRQTVVNVAQFREPYQIRLDSVYGGGKFNSLDPEEYITPEQFQLNRVDVPLNTSFDSERRFIVNIGSTETISGTKFTFWVSALDAPIQKLKGQPSVIEMSGQGLQNASPTASLQAQINTTNKLQQNTLKMITTMAKSLASK